MIGGVVDDQSEKLRFMKKVAYGGGMFHIGVARVRISFVKKGGAGYLKKRFGLHMILHPFSRRLVFYLPNSPVTHSLCPSTTLSYNLTFIINMGTGSYDLNHFSTRTPIRDILS
ncbi:hypothetical protein ACN38_g11196 [Penicillium nordicum]|uniref:Uncharacterized protein n=1 Tax=Penicillium nordicum TaxID=229535 RepID=A0A0M8P0K7_9EURO|nr:hypothetical protein ACN38_g11196 [Penicillium nordicum]